MIAWQHILCAVTFAAGIIDTVAIYKFYAPQIFLHTEAPVASNLMQRKKSLDNISTLQEKKTRSPTLSSPPPLGSSEFSLSEKTSPPNEQRPLKNPDNADDANSDLTLLEFDDLVLVPDQPDIAPKANKAAHVTNKVLDNAMVANAPPSENPLLSDSSPQAADNLTVEVNDDTNTSALLGENPAFVFLFRKNVAELNWRDESKLRQHIRSLRENDLITIRLVGFADPSGSKKYNYYLGLKRARNVARFLSKRGVPRSRIQIISSGEIDETFESIRSNRQDMNQRRRVEVYFTEKDKSTDE